MRYTSEQQRYWNKFKSLQNIPSFRNDPIGYVTSIPTGAHTAREKPPHLDENLTSSPK